MPRHALATPAWPHSRSNALADIAIKAGPHEFTARFEREAAPLTCARFESLLPYRERLIHVRWSGEACWIPLGALDLGLGYENATSFPAPGQILLYPAASARPRSSSLMAPSVSPARSASWPAIIF